jgi:hypothetical protein
MKATPKQALETGAAHAVTRYLAETGLSVEAAFQAHRLENAPLGPWGKEKLTPTERRTLKGIEQKLENAMAWTTGLSLPLNARTIRPRRPAFVPAGEAEMLTTTLQTPALLADPRAVRLEGGGVDVWHSVLVISPTLAELANRRNALYAKCILSPDELRHRITEHLTRPDGTAAPSPSAWCAANGENLSSFLTGLFEAWWALGAQRYEEALAKAKKREKRRELSDRSVLPGTLIDNGFRPDVQAGHLKQLEERTLDLFNYDETAERVLKEMRVHAELRIPQLAALSAPQQRALLAVYRLATPGEEDEMLREWFEVSAPLLWQAMGLERPSDGVKRRHLEALRDMGATMLRYTAIVEGANSRAVEVGECPPFSVAARFYDTGDKRRESTEKLEKDWREQRGRIPDAFRFDIPPVMRSTARRLVLSGDILVRLDAGAKVARGPSESFEPLDFALFLKITQTIQRPHGSRSFVDVAQLLREHYGHLPSFEAQRKKGKLSAQYEKAVAVLEAGQIAKRVTKGHRTKDGEKRDVFELVAGNVLNRTGLSSQAPTLPGL